MSSLLTTRRIFVAVLVLGWFALAARDVVDPDVWWHLKTGELIAADHAVPHLDPFSYTRAGQPWIAHAWLSDLVIYAIYKAGDWAGLIVTFAAIIAAAFFILYSRTGSKPYVAGILVLWGALATRPLWGVRPQMISLLLTSLWLYLLERSEQKRNLLWWTLPLTLLWVNLHAGFALGLALITWFIAGEFFEGALGAPGELFSPRLKSLGIVLVIDLALVAVNPNGTKLYAYPFQTLRSPAMQSSIAEWASPNFHRAEYWPFLFLLMATAVALAWSPRRVRARDILLLLAGTLAALTSIRFIPFFVLVAVPVLSKAVSIEKKSPWEVQPASPRSRLPLPVVFNAAALLGMVVFTAWHISDVVHRQPEAEARVFPAAAASYLRAHPASPIFNHYDWGGYLIWKLYPETRVFIDGRADLYGDDLLRQFAGTYQLRSDWRRALTEWQIGTVLVPPDSALAQALRIDPAWTIGFEDARAVVFVRRASPSATPAPAI